MDMTIEKLITRFQKLEEEYNNKNSTIVKEALLKILEDMKPLSIMAYAVYKRKCKHLGLV